MTIAYCFLLAAFLSAIWNWLSIYMEWRVCERISKPLTMVLLITCALLLPLTSENQWLGKLFIIGLIFSLFGDVFLMLPHNNTWFLLGLVAFFCGHLAYIFGLNYYAPPISSLLMLLAVLIVAFFVVRIIVNGLIKKGERGLIIPVLAYSVILVAMLYSGLSTILRPEWSILSSVVCVIGAALFFVSDSFLSYGMFVAIEKSRINRIIVMVTYFLAQIGLTMTIATWQV
ncbi:MAG: lysoplasmalogenase [Negativicutes bacterium]|jgi:uncharacterized membrane protein YhhN